MSDQETAIVEETTEAEVEERLESTASEPVTTPETEILQNSDDSATVQSEEVIEATTAEATKSTTETPGEAAAEEGVTIHTLQPRQHFAGKVKNITGFGAFVDIGLPQDGLVHISELARQKVDKVTENTCIG